MHFLLLLHIPSHASYLVCCAAIAAAAAAAASSAQFPNTQTALGPTWPGPYLYIFPLLSKRITYKKDLVPIPPKAQSPKPQAQP